MQREKDALDTEAFERNIIIDKTGKGNVEPDWDPWGRASADPKVMLDKMGGEVWYSGTGTTPVGPVQTYQWPNGPGPDEKEFTVIYPGDVMSPTHGELVANDMELRKREGLTNEVSEVGGDHVTVNYFPADKKWDNKAAIGT